MLSLTSPPKVTNRCSLQTLSTFPLAAAFLLLSAIVLRLLPIIDAAQSRSRAAATASAAISTSVNNSGPGFAGGSQYAGHKE
jgi:hypothetical protein